MDLNGSPSCVDPWSRLIIRLSEQALQVLSYACKAFSQSFRPVHAEMFSSNRKPSRKVGKRGPDQEAPAFKETIGRPPCRTMSLLNVPWYRTFDEHGQQKLLPTSMSTGHRDLKLGMAALFKPFKTSSAASMFCSPRLQHSKCWRRRAIINYTMLSHAIHHGAGHAYENGLHSI